MTDKLTELLKFIRYELEHHQDIALTWAEASALMAEFDRREAAETP